MDDRKTKILSAIIQDYITTAEPVGSRTIARKYRIGISPATIRNEMADLEEWGYLCQPHTSAGRVPSNKGYRFYVDFLLPERKLNEKERSLIEKLFKRRVSEIEDLIEAAANAISMLTSYTAVVLGPKLQASCLKHIQIIKLDENRGLIIIVTNYGTISHNIIELPTNLSDSDLLRISNLLNEKLAGKQLSDITPEVVDSIKTEMIEYDGILNTLVDILLQNLDDTKENVKVYSTGGSNLLELPEFKDVERAKNFLSLLEKQDLIAKVIQDLFKPESIAVTIGNENPCEELHEFSIITADFSIDGKNLGLCSVIGPTRMEYSKVISVLKKVSDYLTTTIYTLF